MATLNKTMLIGRLTRDPEAVRTLPKSGNSVIKFAFAVGRSKKNPETGQWDNDPNPLYIDCEAYSRQGNSQLVDLIANYCRKGSQLYVEGRLQLDQWDDKETGVKRSKMKLVIDSIQLLDRRDDGGGSGGGDDYEEEAPRPAPARRAPAPAPSRNSAPARNTRPVLEDDNAGADDDIPF